MRYFSCKTSLRGVVFRETPRIDQPSVPLDHLSVADAEHIISQLKPKVAILTHFGMGMWRAKPWQIAEMLSEQTGVRVLAARDGMSFDLSELNNPG